MSYLYSKGEQVIGDLKAADDSQRNTLIDFGEDQIDFQTSGSIRLNISNDGIYIPDTAQNASLFVSGGIEVTPGNQEGLRFMKSANELNFISFQDGTDGGSYNARMSYNSAEFIFIAPGRGADFFINSSENSGDSTFPFSIMDDGTARFEKGLTSTADRAADLADDIAFFVSGTTDGNNNAVFIGTVVMSGALNAEDNVIVDGRIGIGVDSPSYKLEIGGNMSVGEYIYHRNDTDTYIRFQDNDVRIATAGGERLTVDSNGKVGIGTTTPKIKLDVHHDPTSLANDTGGGEVVKFGSGTLTAGKLYFLSGSTWTETDADSATTGSDKMLGIALGSNPAVNGVLIRGFFDANSYLSNFSAGKAVYVGTTGGGMDTTAPSGGGDFVRIVGYCTTIANVIYFNPSNNWIEL